MSRLVELHLRFHGYGEGEWTDSAVRRYVRDAGPLLTRLHVLTRADCTTRNRAKAQRLARAYDGLEQRIAELGEQEELARIRPELDGNEIMRILGLPPGPVVGRAYDFLLELRHTEGESAGSGRLRHCLRWAADARASPVPEPADEEPERGLNPGAAPASTPRGQDRVAGRHHGRRWPASGRRRA